MIPHIQFMRNLLLVSAALAAGSTVPTRAAGPDLINYQGFLRDDNGQPVEGEVSLEFRIFDVETAGTELWAEVHPTVTVAEGLFHVVLGSVIPLDATIFSSSERWLETWIEGAPLSPRRRFASTPYAMRAAVADVALSGGDSDDDWIISGGDVYRADGAVGIGTDSPAADLHVSGGEESASIRIDADVFNTDDEAHPFLRMTQDGAVVRGEVGFFSDNRFELRQMNTSLGDTVSVVIGGTSSNNVSMNADLEIGGGGSGRSDASSEALVIRGESSSWYVGVENQATPETSGFFVGRSSAGEGTLHIESDGDVGIGTSTPSARLSVAGKVDADSYSAKAELGPGGTPADGGVYGDNVVYAWGHFADDGGLVASFGISNVVHVGGGEYVVYLKRPMANGKCPVVTVESGSPAIATIFQTAATILVVRIWDLNGNGVDLPFFLQVVGRP